MSTDQILIQMTSLLEGNTTNLTVTPRTNTEILLADVYKGIQQVIANQDSGDGGGDGGDDSGGSTEPATYEENVINAESEGADPTQDSSAEIQTLIDTLGGQSGEYTITISENEEYQISQGLTCPYNNINFNIKGQLTYTGTANEPIIEVGDASINCQRKTHTFRVFRDTQSDWSSEDNVGVRLINHFNSEINIKRTAKNTVGLDCVGLSQGFAYNDIHIGEVRDNEIGLLLRSNSNGGAGTGYCNENNFYNGRFWTTSGTNIAQDRWAIVIRSDDGDYPHNNNNNFFGQSIEIAGDTGIATAIRLEDDSRQNFFFRPRLESCDIGWHLMDSAYRNTLVIGYPAIQNELDESENSDNILLNKNRIYLDHIHNSVYRVNDITNIANYWDNIRVHIDGLSMIRSTDGTIYRRDAGYDIYDDYIQWHSGKAAGFMVNTESTKEFMFLRDAVNGNGGRVLIKLYDSSDNVLTTIDHISSAQTSNISAYADFGGSFRTGVDSDTPVQFKVSDSVSYIWIGVQGGSGTDAQIRGFHLLCKGEGQPSTKPGHEGRYGIGFLATEITAGAYKQGDRIYNATPSPEGNVGWVITADGDFDTATPPEFRTFGSIPA